MLYPARDPRPPRLQKHFLLQVFTVLERDHKVEGGKRDYDLNFQQSHVKLKPFSSVKRFRSSKVIGKPSSFLQTSLLGCELAQFN